MDRFGELSSSDFDPMIIDPSESGPTSAAQGGADSPIGSETKSKLDESTPIYSH